MEFLQEIQTGILKRDALLSLLLPNLLKQLKDLVSIIIKNNCIYSFQPSFSVKEIVIDIGMINCLTLPSSFGVYNAAVFPASRFAKKCLFFKLFFLFLESENAKPTPPDRPQAVQRPNPHTNSDGML